MTVSIYYSTLDPNDPSSATVMHSDKDALDLVNFIDGDRVVGVFVDQVNNIGGSDCATESREIRSERLPDVDEGLEYIGRFDKKIGEEDMGLEEESRADGEEGTANGVEGKSEAEGTSREEELGNEVPKSVNEGIFSDIVGLLEVIDGVGSDDELSLGDDSSHSDVLVDSENEGSDDDDLDVNVDLEGLRVKVLQEMSGPEQPKPSRRKGKQKVDDFSVFNQSLDMDDPKFELGLCFPDSKSFRAAVRQHSIVHGRELVFTKNDKDKVQVKCRHKKCPWHIYASQLYRQDTMQVKTLHNVHECTRSERVSAANSRWVAQKYRDKIQSYPDWKISSMMSVVQKDCKLMFSRYQMYRAKGKVAQMSAGSKTQQYGLLYRYAAEIVRTNEGSTVKIKTKIEEGQLLFKRFYCCWGSLKKGFRECRKVIFLDGCHLKTSCGGILLTAIGIDPNNSMYPFAYAVVEKEKRDYWVWFIELLMKDVEISREDGNWTVISDKQKGLIDAIESLMPYCEHRFCVMHLYNNFKLSHKGLALKMILWKAAKSTRVVDFEKVLNELRDRDLKAFKWLAKRPAAPWSRCYFKTHSKCDVLLNNMCESFNAMILEARSKPIIEMLEIIRKILMKRVYVKRDMVQKYNGEICPNIQKLLEDLKKNNMEFIAHWNGHEQFEIEGAYGDKFTVNLGVKECSCKKWQLTGIPCAHAISSLYFMGHKPEDYVDRCYHKSTFLKVYSHYMMPLHGPEEWPKNNTPVLLPPVKERMVGRPKKEDRRKGQEEVQEIKHKTKLQVKNCGSTSGKLGRQGMVMTCRMCGVKGHNTRGCPKNVKNQQKDTNVEVPPPNCGEKKTTRVSKRKQVEENTEMELTPPMRMTRSSSRVDTTLQQRSQSPELCEAQSRSPLSRLQALPKGKGTSSKGQSPSNAKGKGKAMVHSPTRAKGKGKEVVQTTAKGKEAKAIGNQAVGDKKGKGKLLSKSSSKSKSQVQNQTQHSSHDTAANEPILTQQSIISRIHYGMPYDLPDLDDTPTCAQQ